MDGYRIKDGVVHVCPNCTELKEGKERIEKFPIGEVGKYHFPFHRRDRAK